MEDLEEVAREGRVNKPKQGLRQVAYRGVLPIAEVQGTIESWFYWEFWGGGVA